jgi:hypothetical protein
MPEGLASSSLSSSSGVEGRADGRHAAGDAGARRAARRSWCRIRWSRHEPRRPSRAVGHAPRGGPPAVAAHRARLRRHRRALLDQLGLEHWAELSRLGSVDLRGRLPRVAPAASATSRPRASCRRSRRSSLRPRAGRDPEASPPRLRGPRIKKGLPRPVTPDDAVNLADACASRPPRTGSARATARC